jgi:hypothetical protein
MNVLQRILLVEVSLRDAEMTLKALETYHLANERGPSSARRR